MSGGSSCGGLSSPLSPVSSHLDLPPLPVSPASAAEFSQQVAHSSKYQEPASCAWCWLHVTKAKRFSEELCQVNNLIMCIYKCHADKVARIAFHQRPQLVHHISHSVECNPLTGVHSPARPGSTLQVWTRPPTQTQSCVRCGQVITWCHHLPERHRVTCLMYNA